MRGSQSASDALIRKRLRLIAFGAIVAGLTFRTVPLLMAPDMPLTTCDGRAYYDMAVSLTSGRGLYVDDPFLVDACFGHVELGPSHHYAPGLPIIEAGFIELLGNAGTALVAALLGLSWLTVAVAWWATRNLFGSDAAIVVAGAVSLEWTGVVYGTLLGYSENLVIMAITLSLWAILRGIRDDRFIVLAGLFAGIGYLSKASVGWFFLIAGLGGVAYRVIYRGWRVLLNRWYWTAVAVFAVPVVLWSLRNIILFWDGTLVGLADAWQTSALHSRMVAHAFEQPGLLIVGVVGTLPALTIMSVLPYLPLFGGVRAAARQWRNEEAFGMWLGVGLIFVLGWFFAAVFWVSDQTSLLWADPVRYVMPASVPLLWLTVRYGRPSTAAWAATYAILAILSFAPPPLLFQA